MSLSILSAECLGAIRSVMEKGSIIVEHRSFCGGRSPDKTVFDDYEDFLDYLKTKTQEHDSIWVWSYEELCRDSNAVTHGKLPDQAGRATEGGAY